ncbi:acyl-CoA dehydrogenase family protein [Sinorhizobium meliloti]|uniref:acyl-CoA dehydrogenase family protein n=1 Tax=Rhizobium meliloti TaxID=382 RepID=UPI000FDA0188|nr:acyl-CoA dehydrogenase family protein [Sinorhizobium meliloti]RVQ47555.1 acyl-CoA dehydrogenase [Sinorhizobium meliloti]
MNEYAIPESAGAKFQAAPLPFSRWDRLPGVKLGQVGAEPALPEITNDLQRTIHGFAEKVMRPIGRELDHLTPEEVICNTSRLWEFRNKYQELGITTQTLATFALEDLPAAVAILFEELGWGDAGLAVSAGVDLLPHYMAAKFGNEFVAKTYPETLIGCWGITEPDHGSDVLDSTGAIFQRGGNYGQPNCVAKITDGKVIIRGQKSAWVSNGPIAELCILYCAAETDKGIDPRRGAVLIVPLDALGVSKGKPLDKMGQRALPQGEIFFDAVELDIDHLLLAPEDYNKGVYAIHAEANALMGAIFTGVARSAYELAHAYAHERRQGGVPIIRHQDVAKRLFHMARKVEVSRAIARRVTTFNMMNGIPALHAAMFSKVTATQNALEVSSDAIQMFGANGVAREYPVEKIFRDARSSLIEDGCNEILAIKGGTLLIDPELLTATA